MEKGPFKMLARCLLFTATIVLLEIQLSQSCSLGPCTPTEDQSKAAVASTSPLFHAMGLESDDAQDKVKISEAEGNLQEKRQSDENVNRRLMWMLAHLQKPNSR